MAKKTILAWEAAGAFFILVAGSLTYFTPHFFIFEDPRTSLYGIPEGRPTFGDGFHSL